MKFEIECLTYFDNVRHSLIKYNLKVCEMPRGGVILIVCQVSFCAWKRLYAILLFSLFWSLIESKVIFVYIFSLQKNLKILQLENMTWLPAVKTYFCVQIIYQKNWWLLWGRFKACKVKNLQLFPLCTVGH